MTERVVVNTKKPEAKNETSVSRTRKTDLYQSTNSPADHILFLQRTVGNQAVQRLLRSGALQAKLRIGQPRDVYEQEADRVAERVMSMPEPKINRQEEEEVQAKPLTKSITPLVHRESVPEEGEEEEVQKQPEEEEETAKAKGEGGNSPAVSPSVESGINTIRGGGSPLPKSSRAFFEPRFSADFSGVKVHTDSNAAHLARSVNAKAFTVGRDVIFGSGQFSPETTGGKKLLAHELTHTLQQRNESTAKRLVGRNIGNIAVLNTSQQIQKSNVPSLGLAAYSKGKEILSTGNLSHTSTPATYMHPGTPTSAKWDKLITTLHIKAFNLNTLMPGWEHFYFRFEYEFNGYDIRNATINVLRSKSSDMYISTFKITWSPNKHSQPKDPVAQIVFNISGQWDPVDRGDFSFWGKLIISAALNGKNFESFTIGSEKIGIIKKSNVVQKG